MEHPIHPEMQGVGGTEVRLSTKDEQRLIRMLAKAGERFDLHPSVRRYMVKRSARWMRHKNAKVSIAAIRALTVMARIDQKDEQHAQNVILGLNAKQQRPAEMTQQTVIILPDNGRKVIDVRQAGAERIQHGNTSGNGSHPPESDGHPGPPENGSPQP